ncbi:unnamed protein product [Protopolystoma xenopodis]|uniref:Uncharacterized protein n=1 Tax=Protopolystoma xenopodis TaxID=117903 RepID=A0A3S5AY28_9PLAT|nr:unnamed protein product [Protopolystoma xenopodis]
MLASGPMLLKAINYEIGLTMSALISLSNLCYSCLSPSFHCSSHTSARATDQIRARARKSDYTYYADYVIPAPEREYMGVDQSGRRIENPRLEWPNDGYGVASSGLYFLLMIERNLWTSSSQDALDMVHWLASERNHVAGFASTFVSLSEAAQRENVHTTHLTY